MQESPLQSGKNMLYWLHKPAYLPGTGNKPEKKENIMAETTKENKAQRAKKYRRRRVTAAVAAAANTPA